jgi:hypothetical protein
MQNEIESEKLPVTDAQGVVGAVTEETTTGTLTDSRDPEAKQREYIQYFTLCLSLFLAGVCLYFLSTKWPWY